MYKVSGIGNVQENIYFVGNTLFGDVESSKKRSFKSVGHMNDNIIDCWNNIISKRDIVYHLGNFTVLEGNDIEYILKNINGRLNLIVGECDTNSTILKYKKYFKSINYKLNILINNYNISLNSHPQVYWNRFDDDNSFHIYGSYPEGNKIKDPFSLWNAKSLCVDIDNVEINNRPLEFLEVINLFELKLDYFKKVQGAKSDFL